MEPPRYKRAYTYKIKIISLQPSVQREGICSLPRIRAARARNPSRRPPIRDIPPILHPSAATQGNKRLRGARREEQGAPRGNARGAGLGSAAADGRRHHITGTDTGQAARAPREPAGHAPRIYIVFLAS